MIWIGLLYSIKGILIVIGIYLSYETRATKLEKINDAHLVRMCTYNIFVSTDNFEVTLIHEILLFNTNLDRLSNISFIDTYY